MHYCFLYNIIQYRKYLFFLQSVKMLNYYYENLLFLTIVLNFVIFLIEKQLTKYRESEE